MNLSAFGDRQAQIITDTILTLARALALKKTRVFFLGATCSTRDPCGLVKISGE